MAYTKANMLYDDYTWTTKYTDDDPRVRGEPDSTLLARTEGWEMLYFINTCAKKWEWKAGSTSSMQNLEKIIRTKVPGSIRSQKGIKTWIEANYKEI